MKKMTCKELGGACDLVFEGETFEDMAKQSMEHGKEMFQQKDPEHMEAMQKMRELMQKPEEMQKWMTNVKALFDTK